jgi:hypothetical protein
MKSREEIRQLIGEAMGYASMCWDPKPTGEFESTRAKEMADQVIKTFEDRDQEWEKATRVLVEALEFYKSQEDYFNYYDREEETTVIEHDGGHKAREAIAKFSKLKPKGK